MATHQSYDLWPMSLDTSPAPRRYVKVHRFTGILYEDQEFTPEEAEQRNEQLRNDGEPYEWVQFGEQAAA